MENKIHDLKAIRDMKLRYGSPSRNSESYKKGFKFAFDLILNELSNVECMEEKQ